MGNISNIVNQCCFNLKNKPYEKKDTVYLSSISSSFNINSPIQNSDMNNIRNNNNKPVRNYNRPENNNRNSNNNIRNNNSRPPRTSTPPRSSSPRPVISRPTTRSSSPPVVKRGNIKQ